MTKQILFLFLVSLMIVSSTFGQSRSKKSSIDYIYIGSDLDFTRVSRPYATNGALGVKILNSSKRYTAFEVNAWNATQEERETVGTQVSIKGEEKILSINALIKFGFNLTKTIRKGFNVSAFTGFNYWSSDLESFTELYYPVNSDAYNLVVGVEPEYIINVSDKIGIIISAPLSLATLGLNHTIIGDPSRPVEENTTNAFEFNAAPQYSVFRVSLQIEL